MKNTLHPLINNAFTKQLYPMFAGFHAHLNTMPGGRANFLWHYRRLQDEDLLNLSQEAFHRTGTSTEKAHLLNPIKQQHLRGKTRSTPIRSSGKGRHSNEEIVLQLNMITSNLNCTWKKNLGPRAAHTASVIWTSQRVPRTVHISAFWPVIASGWSSRTTSVQYITVIQQGSEQTVIDYEQGLLNQEQVIGAQDKFVQ